MSELIKNMYLKFNNETLYLQMMLYYENVILVVNGSKRMLDIRHINNYVGAK
jgi:hypothetical protein